jgi:hypothetical protein
VLIVRLQEIFIIIFDLGLARAWLTRALVTQIIAHLLDLCELYFICKIDVLAGVGV